MGLTFGALVRAYRLCFGVLPGPAEGLMRLTPTVGGTLCELAPLGQLSKGMSATGEKHYIWWEHDDGRGVIAESPFLRSLRRIKRAFTVVLGEDGMPLRREGKGG